MPAKKMTEKEWAKYIELQRWNKKLKQKLAKKQNHMDILQHYLPGAILVGIIAMSVMIIVYGGKTLLEHVLSWTIGITIVTTVISIFNRGDKKKR